MAGCKLLAYARRGEILVGAAPCRLLLPLPTLLPVLERRLLVVLLLDPDEERRRLLVLYSDLRYLT